MRVHWLADPWAGRGARGGAEQQLSWEWWGGGAVFPCGTYTSWGCTTVELGPHRMAVHVGLYNKGEGGEEWLQQAMAQHGGVGGLLEAVTGAELCQGVLLGNVC
jgi:hypothetical protein